MTRDTTVFSTWDMCPPWKRGCLEYCHVFLLFLQRIAAADLASGLRYFGRHIHGRMDMNEDGLVDLAVGSFGAAVLLWSVCPRFINDTLN